MKQRSRSLVLSVPMLVLVAVMALVLGSFGSAVAGPITKAQVKKIAKSVVKKHRPAPDRAPTPRPWPASHRGLPGPEHRLHRDQSPSATHLP